eukprot:1686906-Rhodomonas_salina.1
MSWPTLSRRMKIGQPRRRARAHAVAAVGCKKPLGIRHASTTEGKANGIVVWRTRRTSADTQSRGRKCSRRVSRARMPRSTHDKGACSVTAFRTCLYGIPDTQHTRGTDRSCDHFLLFSKKSALLTVLCTPRPIAVPDRNVGMNRMIV